MRTKYVVYDWQRRLVVSVPKRQSATEVFADLLNESYPTVMALPRFTVIRFDPTLPSALGREFDGKPNGEANARLISKAWLLPEVIEALEYLIENPQGIGAIESARRVLAKLTEKGE